MRSRWLVAVLLGVLASGGAIGQEIGNRYVTVRAVKDDRGFIGFDLMDGTARAAVARLSSSLIGLTARHCEARNRTLTFRGLETKPGTGLQFGPSDFIQVQLGSSDRFPTVAFDLTMSAFDAARWKRAVGAEPFHFLALYLPEAEAWHQRGWLNATPLADRFPLLEDRHAGTPEISAYHYNRNWSYTPPLGAHPLPVIGLWAPRQARYVGFEFQTTRVEDNSEKDIATGYRWVEPAASASVDAGQFVALVYPSGGDGYQQLVLPAPGTRLKSGGTLLWTLNLSATDDPNRFVWSFLWARLKDRLPPAPTAADVSWIPGGLHQTDFQGPPGGELIGGVENPFQVAGSRLLYGWTWHNESPTAAAARRGNSSRLERLEIEAKELLRLAKRFQVNGDDCVFWEKPLAGEWTAEWGGPPVTTLHNANGFAAGRLFLGLYRDLHRSEYLPVVDGVFNWAKHIVWTRNEFADVPSSPFAIGGTLSASFCLDYYQTFKHSADADHRSRATNALNLARSFTYRYLVMWPTDNNRDDNLDSTFLWEPNSGRDWTGAACANEVFWNLDTLAQTAVHTGDPVLAWAIEGSLSRWYQLYQEVYKDNLATYQAGDLTEGYGLYRGNVYGPGARAAYGFAAPLVMTEPVGRSAIRVLAGEKAALAFRKGPVAAEVAAYRYADTGNLEFTINSPRPQFDLSLTVPYVDINTQSVAIVRNGARRVLQPGTDFLRPPQALWSLYLKDVHGGDQIVVGEVPPGTPPAAGSARPPGPENRVRLADGFQFIPLPADTPSDLDWDHAGSWAGLPTGRFWAWGVPFDLPASGKVAAGTKPIRLASTIKGASFVYLLYSAEEPKPPMLALENGQLIQNNSGLEALAWRAWPPIRSARLLLAQIPVPPGAKVVGIEPNLHTVWAATAERQVAGGKASHDEILAALKAGEAEWRRLKAEDAGVARLSQEIARVPTNRIAILPPKPGGSAFSLAQRIGLIPRAAVLTGEQLVDTAFFNAQRFPVALYLDGEDYVHTVRTSGDGAAAVDRYLKEGGTLILLPTQPWPLYYAAGPGFHRPEPLTERLGLPLMMAVEGAPSEALTVRLQKNQTLAELAGTEFNYPTGDPRLRSIDRGRIPAGVRYVSIARVVGASGKDYGDAAGLVELPGAGRTLYLASVLQRDPERGFAFLEQVFRFAAARTQPK